MTHRTITTLTITALLLATPTTAAATTEPTFEPLPNVCYITGADGDFIPEGQWELTPTEDIGTHSISGMWCGYTTVETGTPPVQSLPATGVGNWALAMIAGLLLAAGAGATLISRRNMRKWSFILTHPVIAYRFHRAANAPWPHE